MCKVIGTDLYVYVYIRVIQNPLQIDLTPIIAIFFRCGLVLFKNQHRRYYIE